MTRKLGAPAGAFFGVYGVQSAFESRTSSLMTALEPGVAADCVCAVAFSGDDRAQPAARTAIKANSRSALRSFMVSTPERCDDCDIRRQPMRLRLRTGHPKHGAHARRQVQPAFDRQAHGIDELVGSVTLQDVASSAAVERLPNDSPTAFDGDEDDRRVRPA